ncbi:aminotransferase class IV [Mucilaginibacter sp. CSA2-8R]|uniref:aminotransferase class IV n=1 Tax=Mucilaginibacter sp. CSA2-8R TaxID=3141542 RepID=UPI00315D82AA
MGAYTIVNNNFLAADQASVLITDLAIQRGYGIFDFFKTINGNPVFFEDHLDRFYRSASEMHLTVMQNRDELKALLFELMNRNNLPNSGIRITLTGGYSPDGYELVSPNLIITQQPLKINTEINQQGIKLITYPHQRQMPQVKTVDYLMAIWLQPLVKERKVDDLLYHDNGLLRECPRSNFFLINKRNEILTSDIQVLKGIIRKQLLSLNGQGFTVYEKPITLTDLETCKEAFITSTTKNILPVTEIDGQLIGDGRAGETTIALYQALQKLIVANRN